MNDDAPILNPRRAPRLPIRCLVRAELGGAPFESQTEDLGPLGCQLVAPAPHPRATPARLVLAWPSVGEQLRVSGQIAWTGPRAPWRHGVAFAPAHHEAAARWLGRLVALHPELAAGPRVPARLEAGARLYLGAPPRFLLDFTSAELEVLRQAQAGVTVGELRRRLAASWEPAVRALFSLLARRAVLLEPAGAAPAHAWAEPLGARAPSGGVAVGRVRLRPAVAPRAD